MSFDNNFLGQLVNKLPTLEEELVQILTATKKPLSVSDIYKQSKVAVTSRDISLLLAQRREALNIEIAHFATRPGFRECAHYQMSTINDQVNDIQLSLVTDTPELKHEEVSEMNTEVQRTVSKMDIFNLVMHKGTVKKSWLYEQLCNNDINKKYTQKYTSELVIKGVLKEQNLEDGKLISLGENANKFLSQESRGQRPTQYKPKVKAPKFKILSPSELNTKDAVKVEYFNSIDEVSGKQNIHFTNFPDPYLEIIASEKIAEEAFVSPVCEISQTAEKRRFRVAITSDRTLLLFGIQSEPIELDIFESDTLIEFCDSVGLSIPMTVGMHGTDSHTVAGKQL